MANATDVRSSSIYWMELDQRRSRIRTGLNALGQVSGVPLSTLQAVRDALRIVEDQLDQEEDKVTRQQSRASRPRSECYCDYTFHPEGH